MVCTDPAQQLITAGTGSTANGLDVLSIDHDLFEAWNVNACHYCKHDCARASVVLPINVDAVQI